MNRRERRVAARKSQKASSSPGASTPAALHEAGLRHLRAGEYLDAQLCCQQALAVDSGHADTLHLMGLLAAHAGQHDHAVEWFARALRQDTQSQYLASLGTALQAQGRFEQALTAFDKAVQLGPDDTGLWINLGNVLADLERPAEALLAFQHVLKLDPRHWDAAYRCGFLLHRLGRSEEAVSSYDLADGLRPNHAVILEMRAIALHGLKRFGEALADNKRAHALNPANADTCNNIGAVLQSLGRDEEALPWFDKALKLRPGFIMAFTNKASSLQQLHRFDEAFAIYRHVKAIAPDCAQADWSLSLLQMLHGDFEAGWAGREARWKAHAVAYPKFFEPIWLGEGSIEGKTILICADEGLGDSIQFARYVPMVAARGARVILVVDDAAYPLLSALSGVAQCFPKSAGMLPAFDMHCPMSSLPLAFATRLDTIPPGISYLPAPAESRVQAWEGRLGPHERLRVGLVWSGNPKHINDHNRSIPLRTLARILDLDATFVSLQKDARPDDRAMLRERTGLIDLTAEFTDFSETAALVSCLDLVITVDTSVAHLSAALGRPTWILLPYTSDYRWLLDRDDSPWYPTVRLFRQPESRDYADVIDRVRTELAALIPAFGPVKA
jgi:tetratricopeptide (TPR) repeat protein